MVFERSSEHKKSAAEKICNNSDKARLALQVVKVRENTPGGQVKDPKKKVQTKSKATFNMVGVTQPY